MLVTRHSLPVRHCVRASSQFPLCALPLRRTLSSTPQWMDSHKHQTSNNGRQKDAHNNDKTPVEEYLDSLKPHLDRAHTLYRSTSRKWHSLSDSIAHHYNKAKQAIRDTNAKLAQQERELATYDFNEDFTTPSDANTHKTKISGLPSERERHRKLWTKRLELYIDSLQETIFTATRALNDVTGYSAIQKLRESIDALEKELAKARDIAKTTKDMYNDAISERLETQREVNELLQRKSSWSPQDLERFTKLYKEDHTNATNEREAKLAMDEAEIRHEELSDKLSSAILTRYHEEQIWSDKIRRTSTWGTFALMGMNILLFLVFQLLLEPWKRRRLVGNFEQKVQQVLEKNTSEQNQRLDLMAAKMEELKNSDLLPSLEEGLPSELEGDYDDGTEMVLPPNIQQLPLPPSISWKLIIGEYIHGIINRLKEPYSLLFYSHYSSTVLDKQQLVSTVSLAGALGVLVGSLLVLSLAG